MSYICSVKRFPYLMTWNEFRRAAEKCGFEFVRHGSAHDVYCHPVTKERLYIERHGNQEIRKGLMKTLLKQIESYR